MVSITVPELMCSVDGAERPGMATPGWGEKVSEIVKIVPIKASEILECIFKPLWMKKNGFLFTIEDLSHLQ